MKKVIVNKVRCKKCNDIIESKYIHDMQYCKCKSIYIDGGKEYQRCGWKSGKQDDYIDDYIDFSYSVYEKFSR
ncbi:hypothetical protein [Paraliobacillus sp. JSM ZJ581]|uniref:DUF7695 domain-containing protein n=1 Tax=Paraliobacillus sp. JSM ZJ581 TaxID=3342118 RepID=UPI0035A831EC